MRISSLIVICMIGASSPSAAIAQAQAQPAPQVAATPATDLPDGPGKDRLLATCGSCHDPRIVIGQHHDLPGWQELIDQMIARGANVSDPDYAAISAYLAKNNP